MLTGKVDQAASILRDARERYRDRLVYSASLGAESSVLIDLICR
ncbi:phosphoadenosine phosphosulfate reductase, partial [Candidatus Parcubacteria bacterium]